MQLGVLNVPTNESSEPCLKGQAPFDTSASQLMAATALWAAFAASKSADTIPSGCIGEQYCAAIRPASAKMRFPPADQSFLALLKSRLRRLKSTFDFVKSHTRCVRITFFRCRKSTFDFVKSHTRCVRITFFRCRIVFFRLTIKVCDADCKSRGCIFKI